MRQKYNITKYYHIVIPLLNVVKFINGNLFCMNIKIICHSKKHDKQY